MNLPSKNLANDFSKVHDCRRGEEGRGGESCITYLHCDFEFDTSPMHLLNF